MSVLQEEARVRLRLEDRIRQLEESLRTSTDENKKLQKRVDMMVSVFPEIEKHSDLAAVLRDRDDEIRRLKGAAVFERDVQPVVRVCSCDQKRAAAQKTISDLRAQLEAANARIKLLEPLMVNEVSVVFRFDRSALIVLSARSASQDGGRACAGDDVARGERGASGDSRRGGGAQDRGQEAGGYDVCWVASVDLLRYEKHLDRDFMLQRLLFFDHKRPCFVGLAVVVKLQHDFLRTRVRADSLHRQRCFVDVVGEVVAFDCKREVARTQQTVHFFHGVQQFSGALVWRDWLAHRVL